MMHQRNYKLLGFLDKHPMVLALNNKNINFQEFISNADELPGYIQVFGHTLHAGGALEIDKHLWCLDCRKGFQVTPSPDKTNIEIREL